MTTLKNHKRAVFLFLALFTVLVMITILFTTRPGAAGKSISPTGSVVKTEKGQYTNLTVPELQAMLQHKDFTFVNVHVPYKGHIAQTDAFIPYDQITKNLDKLPADKNAKIVLYCHGGNMSAVAARTLADLGYRNVSQLVGGFADWQAAGLPLETQQP